MDFLRLQLPATNSRHDFRTNAKQVPPDLQLVSFLLLHASTSTYYMTFSVTK